MPRLAVVLIAACLLPACKKKPRASTRTEAAPRATLAAPDGAVVPSFIVINSPSGQRQMSPADAVALLTEQCDGKDGSGARAAAISCFSLGQLAEHGQFVTRELPRAIQLFERACTGGEMRACSELGVMADAGEGMPADAARAHALFKQACDGGHGQGCNNLIFLHPDRRTPEDVAYVVARERAICADPAGDGEACASLGTMHAMGTHVPEDLALAVTLFDQACTRKHPTGCNNLGAMYALGKGVAADKERALQYYTVACSLGSPEGCQNAGIDPVSAPMQIIKPK